MEDLLKAKVELMNRKAIGDMRYEFVAANAPDLYHEIVGFSSMFGGSHLSAFIPLEARAQVEAFCMYLVKETSTRIMEHQSYGT